MDSQKETVIYQLGFTYPIYHYVDYYSIAEGAEWVNQETEMLVEHAAYLLLI